MAMEERKEEEEEEEEEGWGVVIELRSSRSCLLSTDEKPLF